MTGPHRLPEGGLVDRSRPLRFRFDGRPLTGYAGDTLASALLANGVRLVARSFKYHRPRGVFAAGSAEPNALVRLRRGGRAEPNSRATMVELFDGLEAESQNRFPHLAFDLGAAAQLFAPLLPAGFYYKTFKWPPDAWMFYERFIRRAAGLGRAPDEPDPDRYERCHLFCDVVVVGAGPAGLAAARELGRAGARVVLLEEGDRFGGSLLAEGGEIEGEPALAWLDGVLAELESLAGLRLFRRTTAFGLYDHGRVAAVERVADHLPEPPPHLPRQRLLKIRARAVLLATGAVERPIVFGDNDLPGVVLASAARAHLHRHAVAPGRRPVVFTNNDSGLEVAIALAEAGLAPTVVDPRLEPDPDRLGRLRRLGGECLAGRVVRRARGFHAVRAVELCATTGGRTGRLACDVLLVSGGWTPNLGLWAQRGVRPEWDERRQAWLARADVPGVRLAGAAAGFGDRPAALAHARWVAARIAADLGLSQRAAAPAVPEPRDERVAPVFVTPGPGKRFVDLQNDVTVEDVQLAVREGMTAIEHVKRWTTLGMGTDQGRTGGPLAPALVAAELGTTPDTVGTTTARPPWTPVAFGALAGEARGGQLAPVRLTPLHDLHRALGAVFVDSDRWQRPRYYPRPGEGLREAYVREAAQVRRTVGITDVSTLGKIEVFGPGAAELLSDLYVNRVEATPPGRARYGVMLREDGFVFDDGTVTRLAPDRLFLTTSTAHAAAVLRHLEYHAQVVRPELRVQITDVTERWAAVAVAGPESRALLEAALGIRLPPAELPFMGALRTEISGVEARILRVSFSGELAFELYVAADFGTEIGERLLDVGGRFGVVPYGLEAMAALRIEKGHPAGPELDGRTTLDDLGLGRLAADKPFVGRPMMGREALRAPDRPQLVALVSKNGRPIRPGSLLFAEERFRPHLEKLGHVTSATFSPALRSEIALALVARGRERIGRTLFASSPLHGEHLAVEVRPACLFDPEGKRMRDARP